MKLFRPLILLTFLIINASQLWAQQTANSENQRITYISGKIADGLVHDTLSLILNGPFYSFGEPPERNATRVLKTTADRYGNFVFKIHGEDSPFHVSLFLSSQRSHVNGVLLGEGAIDNYLIDAGDSVNVAFSKSEKHFTGRDALLFEAQYKIEKTDIGGATLTHDENDYFRKDVKKWLDQRDSLLNVQLYLLESFRSKLSPISYGIVRADVIGVNRAWIYRRISFAGPFFVAGTPLQQDLANLCSQLEKRPAYVDLADRSALSSRYIHYLYDKLRTEIKYKRIINNENAFVNESYFSAINDQYTGVLRDKLLAYWLTQINDLQPEYMKAALAVMQTPVFRQSVKDLEQTFSKGQPVLKFDFKDPKDKTVSLEDYRGKVLFIDLWFSGCSGCVAVAAGLPDVEQAFKNREDVKFISISIDKEKKTWLKSIDKNPIGKNYTHYTTSTTTYLYTGGTAQFNPFIKAYVPSDSYPTLLIIDKKGKLFSATPSLPITQKGKVNLIKEINQALAM